MQNKMKYQEDKSVNDRDRTRHTRQGFQSGALFQTICSESVYINSRLEMLLRMSTINCSFILNKCV